MRFIIVEECASYGYGQYQSKIIARHDLGLWEDKQDTETIMPTNTTQFGPPPKTMPTN